MSKSVKSNAEITFATDPRGKRPYGAALARWVPTDSVRCGCPTFVPLVVLNHNDEPGDIAVCTGCGWLAARLGENRADPLAWWRLVPIPACREHATSPKPFCSNCASENPSYGGCDHREDGMIANTGNFLGKSEARDTLSQRKVVEPVLRAVADVILDGGPEGGLGAPPFWEDRLYEILLDVFDYGETGLPPACLGALCPKCAGPDAALPDFAPMQRCQNCGVPFLIHPKGRGDSTSSQDEEMDGIDG